MRNRSHRFWPCIAAAIAVSVIVVPAASARVHKYKTQVQFGWDPVATHVRPDGELYSKSRTCVRGRRVVLFKQRPGAGPDRKIAHERSRPSQDYETGFFLMMHTGTFHRGDRLYVKVERKVLNDGDVCRGARSRTQTVRHWQLK